MTWITLVQQLCPLITRTSGGFLLLFHTWASETQPKYSIFYDIEIEKTTAKLYMSVALQRSTCCLIPAVLCVELKISTTKQHQLHLAASFSGQKSWGWISNSSKAVNKSFIFIEANYKKLNLFSSIQFFTLPVQ